MDAEWGHDFLVLGYFVGQVIIVCAILVFVDQNQDFVIY
jgi:hypothetical protein